MSDNLFLDWFQSSYPKLKRVMDILISGTGICLLTPLLLIVAIAVRLTSEGPVLFWSTRKGFNGEPFPMPKFRTMTVNSKVMSREIASSSDVKLTKIGLFLRKTSLDELPQLWSVFKGDMSLVGPRPLLFNDYADGDRSKYPQIYNVKPGITGLAQINGRSFIKPSKKARYDAFYAGRVCMILDLKILSKTFATVMNVKMVK